ncbi:MAG: hypothetical protein Q4A86_04820 [Clostridia bacterium]|nr:hypothetical protein [Clostridia bacterium]
MLKIQQSLLFSDNPEIPVLSFEGVNNSIAGFNITNDLKWPNFLVDISSTFQSTKVFIVNKLSKPNG